MRFYRCFQAHTLEPKVKPDKLHRDRLKACLNKVSFCHFQLLKFWFFSLYSGLCELLNICQINYAFKPGFCYVINLSTTVVSMSTTLAKAQTQAEQKVLFVLFCLTLPG